MAAGTVASSSDALAPALARFNLLPSSLAHPEQLQALLPAPMRPAAADGRLPAHAMHRHASAALLRQPGWEPVRSLRDPALPLGTLEVADFAKLVLWCGLALLGPLLRRVIVREDVIRLQADCGADGLAFARHEAAGIWPHEAAPSHGGEPLRAQALGLGESILHAAFGEASPAVRDRAWLRLSPQAAVASRQLPGALAGGPAALSLARSVLKLLHPSWFSLFPAPR